MNLKINLFCMLTIMLLLLGCSQTIKQETPGEPLKVAVQVWAGNGPIYVAQEKGFFAEEGVDVKVLLLDTTTIRPAFLSGEVDAIFMPSESMQILYDSNKKFSIIMNTDYSNGGDGIVAAGNINSIADLKGKKIAYEKGSPSHMLLDLLLERNGLTNKDVISVETPTYDAGTVFLSGDVDAAVTWEPWLSKASERAGGKLLYSTKGDPLINNLGAFSAEVLTGRPEDVKRFMKAYFKALDYTYKNPTESYEIMAKKFGVSVEDIVGMREGLTWMSQQDNVAYLGNGKTSGEVKIILEKAGDLWIKEGFIKKRGTAEELVDGSLLAALND